MAIEAPNSVQIMRSEILSRDAGKAAIKDAGECDMGETQIINVLHGRPHENMDDSCHDASYNEAYHD